MLKSEEPRALREIHEIREKIFEETKNMAPEERAERRNKIGKEIAEKYGLKVIQKV
jgi:hypothetical protein